jgi:hypothetical protein
MGVFGCCSFVRTVDELASLWDADIASADDWEEEKHKVEMLSK